jgi:alkanesulfonate monooxygenase SsuD/methylene tetrahydromethanopterin reductase-like flavin-dependent oxidoreductase (luciferase family)
MRFGLQVNPYYYGATGNPWDLVAPIARVLDKSRLDSLWVYDHLLYEGGYAGHPDPEPVMECFTVLGAIAAITERLRLGQLVLGIPYRNPALTAKMATTLDQISHGRTILGIGAGWHQREYEAYGFGEWEPVGVRMKRLEEATQEILALWGSQPVPAYQGQYYHTQELTENPLPVQKPHPPIMIGGSGEKVTLRLVAQYAQFCNVGGDPETVGRLLEALKGHCDRLGRDYDAITKSCYTMVMIGKDEAEVAKKRETLSRYIPRRGASIGTPEQLIEEFRRYRKAGVEYLIFRMPDWTDAETIQLFSDTVAAALENE